jgi:hypothetical protein
LKFIFEAGYHFYMEFVTRKIYSSRAYTGNEKINAIFIVATRALFEVNE